MTYQTPQSILPIDFRQTLCPTSGGHRHIKKPSYIENPLSWKDGLYIDTGPRICGVTVFISLGTATRVLSIKTPWDRMGFPFATTMECMYYQIGYDNGCMSTFEILKCPHLRKNTRFFTRTCQFVMPMSLLKDRLCFINLTFTYTKIHALTINISLHTGDWELSPWFYEFEVWYVFCILVALCVIFKIMFLLLDRSWFYRIVCIEWSSVCDCVWMISWIHL